MKHYYSSPPKRMARHTALATTLAVTDTGQPFDPNAVTLADTTLDADARPIGGLGIHLMRRYTDSLTYQRQGNRNVLRMETVINKETERDR